NALLTVQLCSLKRPVPTRSLLHCFESSCFWPMIPTRPEPQRNHGNATHGRFVVTETVSGSTTFTSVTSENTNVKGSGFRAGYLPRYASRLFFTTCAVSGDPSENVTFGRSLIVHSV